MKNKGRVVLIGAGPGDVGLLTLNAINELEKAQVVVYDRLVSESIMELAPQSAELINVGKIVGHHPIPQHEINRILLNKALEGYNVVRLKGGDSFVFGRGGEELELIYEHGIEFKVVPGITSSLSAATYAGIPITHRDFCSSFHIITGHKKQNGSLDIDYESLTKLNGTLVFMMSVASSSEIAFGLISSGMDKSMPCAVVENGTRANQRKLVSTLETLGEDIVKNDIKSPAIIIVGKVCALSNKFDWFSNLPLKGKKILVTRPKAQSKIMLCELRALGAQVDAIPAIKTVYTPFCLPVLSSYSWVAFTSSAGVDAFFEQLNSDSLDARAFGNAKVAAVGAVTAKCLNAHAIKADFVPESFSGEALACEMLAQNIITSADKLLIVHGTKYSPALGEKLSQSKVPYDQLCVYDTLDEIAALIDPAQYDLVTFTSASCVKAFAKHTDPTTDFSKIQAVCIGEQTAQKAVELGLKVIVSKQATINSMIERIKEII